MKALKGGGLKCRECLRPEPGARNAAGAGLVARDEIARAVKTAAETEMAVHARKARPAARLCQIAKLWPAAAAGPSGALPPRLTFG
jgi:hypothetical protein